MNWIRGLTFVVVMSRHGKIGPSDSFREQASVDGVDDGLGADLSPAKKSPVEALDRVFASLYSIEFEVDVALRVWIQRNMDNVAVLLFTFGLDIVF